MTVFTSTMKKSMIDMKHKEHIKSHVTAIAEGKEGVKGQLSQPCNNQLLWEALWKYSRGLSQCKSRLTDTYEWIYHLKKSANTEAVFANRTAKSEKCLTALAFNKRDSSNPKIGINGHKSSYYTTTVLGMNMHSFISFWAVIKLVSFSLCLCGLFDWYTNPPVAFCRD